RRPRRQIHDRTPRAPPRRRRLRLRVPLPRPHPQPQHPRPPHHPVRRNRRHHRRPAAAHRQRLQDPRHLQCRRLRRHPPRRRHHHHQRRTGDRRRFHQSLHCAAHRALHPCLALGTSPRHHLRRTIPPSRNRTLPHPEQARDRPPLHRRPHRHA